MRFLNKIFAIQADKASNTIFLVHVLSLVSRNSDALLHMSEDMFTSFVSMA